MSLAIDPANGMVAVEFLDDEDDEETESTGTSLNPYGPTADADYSKAVFAMCLGVGKTYDGKPLGYKRGDTLVVRKSAERTAIEVGDEGCLISSYDVLGKVKA